MYAWNVWVTDVGVAPCQLGSDVLDVEFLTRSGALPTRYSVGQAAVTTNSVAMPQIAVRPGQWIYTLVSWGNWCIPRPTLVGARILLRTSGRAGFWLRLPLIWTPGSPGCLADDPTSWSEADSSIHAAPFDPALTKP